MNAPNDFEKEALEQGYKQICGIDEVGRGPLAGPVMAAAVVLPDKIEIDNINDSKKVSEKKREAVYEAINKAGIVYGIGRVEPEYIDRFNILQATYEAMRLALSDLKAKGGRPDFLLVDAVTIPDIILPQKGIIKGDAKSISIAAASILAKVTRDNLMAEYAKEYPQYGFEKHKGYPTKQHIEAIEIHGVCPIHRRSFLRKLNF